MKKVLMISYAFPPQNIVGATRIFKFCKYLPKHGWQPYVITRAIRKNAPLDEKNRLDVSNPTEIYRCPDIEPYGWGKSLLTRLIWSFLDKFILVPDRHMLWNIPVFFKTISLIKKNQIDVVFCSVPPYSSLIGGALAAKITGCPLIADFRDLWTEHEYFETHHIGRRMAVMYENILEDFVFRSATKVILNTPRAEAKMRKKYIKYTHKFHIITNGFDWDDFVGVAGKKFDKFTIIHTGSFYLERNPILFLKGFASWLKTKNHIINDLQVIFAGRGARDYQKLAIELEIDRLFQYMEQIPKDLLFQYTKGAHLLLIFLGFDTKSDYVTPAKTYEYMAVAKPVLGFVPPDSQAKTIIEKNGLGDAIVVDDITAVERVLNKYYHYYKTGKLSNYAPSKSISQYDYKQLTEKLVSVLDQAT